MERISSFDAKTHLSKILAEVGQGKEYIITRHNQEIAKLVPFDNSSKNILQAITDLKKNRIASHLSLTEINEYRKEGSK